MTPWAKEQGKPMGKVIVLGGFFGPFFTIVFLISGLKSLLSGGTLGSITLGWGNSNSFLAYAIIYSWQYLNLAWLSKLPSVRHANKHNRFSSPYISSQIALRFDSSFSLMEIKITPSSRSSCLASYRRGYILLSQFECLRPLCSRPLWLTVQRLLVFCPV